MTYSPQNKTVYTAAYAGALAGIAVSLKVPVDGLPTDPENVGFSDLAGAWAQSFDTEWSGAASSTLDVLAIEECSAAFFIGSCPPNEPPFNEPSNWLAICHAIVSIVKAGENYFATQGITPDPWPSGGTPGTAAFNPAWYAVTDIYWDPAGTAGGSDANTGTTIGSPLLTFKEIVRRYGSSSPQMNYGQNVTIHLLTSQPAGQDPVFFTPYVSGGGYVALIGTPILSGGASSSVVVTPKAQGGPGTLLQITGFGALAQGQLVHNTSLGSYAFVDGAASPFTMTQPIPAANLTTIGLPTFAEDNGWASGNTYQALTLPSVNLKAWRPRGGDVVGSAVCASWVQFVSIADASGTGVAEYGLVSDCANSTLSSCTISTRLHMATLNGRGQSINIIGCDCKQQVVNFSGSAPMLFGGVLRSGFQINSGGSLLDGDIIVHGASFLSDQCQWGFVYSDGTVTVEDGGCLIAGQDVLGVALWGSFSLTISPQGAYVNRSGTTFAATLLTSGALKLGTNTTGSFFTPGTGLWTSAINLTPANMDTNNGLQNPQTGARFCNSQ